jgi:hypothetical protein
VILTLAPIILELVSVIGLELKIFGSLVSIEKVILGVLKSILIKKDCVANTIIIL